MCRLCTFERNKGQHESRECVPGKRQSIPKGHLGLGYLFERKLARDGTPEAKGKNTFLHGFQANNNGD